MQKKVPAIIFGDYVSAYGVIRGLKNKSIPIFMVSKSGRGLATNSKYVEKSFALNPYDKDFISKLNFWFCKNINSESVILIAGDDDYLDTLSKNIKELNHKMKPTFPAWEKVRLVREKRYTYEIAESLGIPIPKTYLINSKEELIELINSQNKKLSYPILMKPEDSGEFLRKYQKKGIVCHHKNDLLNAYDKYDIFKGNLLLQDLIPGEESRLVSSLITLNKESCPTGCLINYKRRSSGKFLPCTVVASTWSDEVLSYSLKLLKAIGYYGYAGTQFKLDPRNGKYTLMEINGRITMSNSIGLKCGINLPYLMYNEAINENTKVIINYEKFYPENIIWIYLAGDILSLIRNHLYLKPFTYIKSLIGKKYIIEPLSLYDPIPGLLSIILIPERLLKKAAKKIILLLKRKNIT